MNLTRSSKTGAKSDVARTMAMAAVDNIPGPSWSGISLIDGHTARPAVPTDTVAEEIDAHQARPRKAPTSPRSAITLPSR